MEQYELGLNDKVSALVLANTLSELLESGCYDDEYGARPYQLILDDVCKLIDRANEHGIYNDLVPESCRG